MSAEFAATVESAFRFLEGEGFRVSARSPDHVRYESDEVWLEIWHDPRAEVDVSFGRLEKGRRESFSLWDVADLGQVALRQPAYNSGTTPVASVLDELASFTRDHCAPYLRADPDAYRDLAEFQAVASGMTTQVASAQSRPSSLWLPISKAWSAGRLAEVARLIESLPKPLTEWESRALEYAARKSRPAQPPRKTRFETANPILRVRDMTASVRYYVEVLGFANAAWGSNDFTFVSRDGAGIYLCRDAQGCRGTWAWIGVEDAAVLYEEYRASGAKLRGEPRNHPWALEIQVEDPDGHVLRFGSDPLEDRPFASGRVDG